jgi:hypothetical protein
VIDLKELLGGKDFNSLPSDHQGNLMILLEKINKIRIAYGKPMIVTSGYRSLQEHLDIYKRKGITDQNRIPMQSKHLYGQAVDISDPKGELDTWCQNNVKLLEDIGLWLEHPDYTLGWTHFQIVPPKSGNRFFIP